MIEALLSGLFWRLRGVMGWPFTLLFSLVQVWTILPISSEFGLLFGLWILLGEPTGWKPKYANGGEWWKCAIHGARIGLIGAIAVPLSTAIQMMFGEPRIKFLENPEPVYLPFWRHPKYLLYWRGGWNEVWFGMIFSGVLQICV